MITKKYMKFFALIMCLGILAPGKTYGMNAFKQRYQTFKQNFTWKKAALVGIAGGCTATQYGIACKSLSGETWDSDNSIDRALEAANGVHPQVECFIEDVLSDSKIDNILPLKIKSRKNSVYNMGSARTRKYNWIILDGCTEELLERALILNDDNTPMSLSSCDNRTIRISPHDFLLQMAAVIHHEKGHIDHADIKKRQIAPFLVAGMLGATLSYEPRFIKNFWLKNIFKIGSGFLYSRLAVVGLYAYDRHQELLADDAIPNNIHLLKAFKEHLKDRLFLSPSLYEKRTKLSEIFGHDTHPHPKDRIKRIKKRIKALKEKKLTNMRASGTDEMIKLTPPRPMELETCMEWIMPDELIEVTPAHIRLRKKILKANLRK